MSTLFESVGYRGVLSDRGIVEAMHKGDLYIAPFSEEQLQPSGYNLTPTRFFYSNKRKCFLPVIENSDEVYVMIDANDTVLVRTRESIAVSSSLTGAFFSKVKVVSEGFGHISTTLDPSWEGQLLISLNNPTKKKKKFSIEKRVYGKTIYNSFVTVEFMGLDCRTDRKADNPPGRIDILRSTLEKNISTFKKNKVEQLRQLIEELNICEEETIETILLQELNQDEKAQWRNIQGIQDDREYELERKNFLKEKERKYLRLIQRHFEENALRSIELVNEYITRKQRYRTLRSKIWSFCLRHKYQLFGVLLTVAVCGFWYWLIRKEPHPSQAYEREAFTAVVAACLMYIVFPTIKEVFIRINPNR